MSSGKLDKYKYLTSEDLKVKPDVIDQAGFVASSLGRVCNKVMSRGGRRENS